MLRKISKRISILLLVVCMLLGLTACDSVINSEETINFDLSQYKEHGKLVCGLIWVIKEDSDWDEEPEKKFAYLDAKGNVKSPWFSLNKYRSPEDFSNGYVILIERSVFEELFDYSNCVVYNTKFQEIASLNCRIPPLSEGEITDFDTQGYAYALGYDKSSDDDVLYWIDSSGLHKFEKNDRLDFSGLDKHDLNKFKVSNNCFVAVSGSTDPQYLYTTIAKIYDSEGDLILDIESVMEKHIDDFSITSAEVLDNNTVKIYFYSSNKKRYVCTMNFEGVFVKEPEEV